MAIMRTETMNNRQMLIWHSVVDKKTKKFEGVTYIRKGIDEKLTPTKMRQRLAEGLPSHLELEENTSLWATYDMFREKVKE